MILRKITEEDRPKIDALIAKDKFHSGDGTSGFFFQPFSEGIAFENEAGDAVYFRIARALRINAVFDCDARASNKEIMTEAAKFFEANARTSGFREILYTSENPLLRKFGTTVGFAEQPDLVMNVEPSEEK